jgi:hypothetical protein
MLNRLCDRQAAADACAARAVEVDTLVAAKQYQANMRLSRSIDAAIERSR